MSIPQHETDSTPTASPTDVRDPHRLRPAVFGSGAPGPVEERWVTCATTHGWWIVDLLKGQLCRTDQLVEPWFVAPEHWTPYEAVWLGADEVRADLVSGSILRARRADGPVTP